MLGTQTLCDKRDFLIVLNSMMGKTLFLAGISKTRIKEESI